MLNIACTHTHRNHPAPLVIPQGPAQLPEAPVSLNCFVDLPGVGRTQVTARGASGLEAAQNLKGSVGALQDVFTPPAPPTREARLTSLLACGTLRAIQRGDMGLVERLVKGFTLAVKGLVELTDVPHTLAVRSQTKSDTWYNAEDNGYCSCPDWAKHQAEPHYRCKHGVAGLFYRRVEEESLKA